MITKQKQIERQKEIEKAAYAYVNWTKVWMQKMADKARNRYNKSDREEIEEAFVAGAKFADKCPRRGLVKIEDVRAIYRMWLVDKDDGSVFPNYFDKYCDKEGWL